MEEYTQPDGEVHLDPSRENRPSEQPDVQEEGEKKKSKKKRNTNSYQKRLSPSGKSTMPV